MRISFICEWVNMEWIMFRVHLFSYMSDSFLEDDIPRFEHSTGTFIK